MEELSLEAREWNRQVFENVFFLKKQLLARLEGIQRALKTHTTRNLRRVEAKIREELE